MIPLSNENAMAYKVYPILRLFIITVGHMATKWGCRPPQNNASMQFSELISISKCQGRKTWIPEK